MEPAISWAMIKAHYHGDIQLLAISILIYTVKAGLAYYAF